MRAAHQALGLALVILGLSACSSGQDQKFFSLDGVAAAPAVCPADPSAFVTGTPVPDFSEGNGCGIVHAWKISAVEDVRFSPEALTDCTEANAMRTWLDTVVQPAARAVYGQRVTGLTILASYSCRARNNVAGAKLSEHGHGNAIDVGAFILADGREVNVERDYYGAAADQQFLTRVRGQACGIFHTVLGPGSDDYHRNHFHLDMQPERRGGPYCH